MSYTKEQEAVVLRVLSYKGHQYYEILEVSKTSTDSEIKKSYRRLAIKCHPDKNPHPRSSEAFKVVNKSWEVLSDPQKRRIYDQTGTDPTSRISSASATSQGFGSFTGTRGFASGTHGSFDDDLFNMFFGNGGSPFASGPTFTFGGNGFTFQSFGGGQDPFMRHRRTTRRTPRATPNTRAQSRDETQGPQSFSEVVKNLLPLLLVLIVPILSALFSNDPSSDYSFVPTTEFRLERKTPKYNIPYFVNDKFSKKMENKSRREIKNFGSKVENMYIQDKRAKCSREQIHKDNLIEDAVGWFSTDMRKLERAQNMPMPNCDILRSLNLI
ncbi:HLJ1 [Candida theae]|uniref:HLJ1 n=1 Tax=Candida theae TaxID=1198502 RepID=A0AAD5BDN8_9ASCO|nr:HLJ1 [Candida theae]KAI5957020.1 HLJ1 [Candida theae]